MSPESVKLFGPVILFLFWLLSARKYRDTGIVLATLFFASYVGAASNFSWYYREIHQAIQALICMVFAYNLLRTRRLLAINRPLLVFLGFVVLSVIGTEVDADMHSSLINIAVSFCVVNFLYQVVSRDRYLHVVLEFIAGLSVVVAILGLSEALALAPARVEATFSNPNYYGMFLGIGSCIWISKGHGFCGLAAAALVVAAIVLSGSRSAMVFPLLQILWMSRYAGSRTRALTIATVSIASFFALINLSTTRISDLEQLRYNDTERVLFAKVAIRMAGDHPVNGVGWGRFISEYSNYTSVAERSLGVRVRFENPEMRRRVTHNDYLRILAELGWVAFSSCLVFSLYSLVILWRHRAFGIEYLAPVYVGMLMFSLGHNNLNGAFFWFVFLLPYWLYLRLKQCPGERRSDASPALVTFKHPALL